MRFHRFLIAGLVLLLDQAAKAVIVARFAQYTVVPVIPGFFRLVRVENTGMAFGLFSDSSSPLAFWLLTLVSAAVLGVVAFLMWKDSTSSSLGGLALAV